MATFPSLNVADACFGTILVKQINRHKKSNLTGQTKTKQTKEQNCTRAKDMHDQVDGLVELITTPEKVEPKLRHVLSKIICV